MLDPACKARNHSWIERDGQRICSRPGCGKVFGERAGKSTLTAKPSVVQKAPPMLGGSGIGGATPVPSGGGLQGAAARLAARRGLALPAEPEPAELAKPAEKKPAEPRESLSDWFGKSIPDVYVWLCGAGIKAAGRKPWEPDEKWMGRMRRCYERSLGQLLPDLDIPPGWGLAIAAVMVPVSMVWDSEKIIKPAKPTVESKPSENKAVPTEVPCQTGASQTSPVATVASVVSSAEPPTALEMALNAGYARPAAKPDGGLASTVPPSWSAANQETVDAGSATSDGKQENTPSIKLSTETA
jgi:hypothetical protein